MHGWIVRITHPIRGSEPLVWEFKMLTSDRETALSWGRAYEHKLPNAIVEALLPF